jgi:hypothetical protein
MYIYIINATTYYYCNEGGLLFINREGWRDITPYLSTQRYNSPYRKV